MILHHRTHWYQILETWNASPTDGHNEFWLRLNARSVVRTLRVDRPHGKVLARNEATLPRPQSETELLPNPQGKIPRRERRVEEEHVAARPVRVRRVPAIQDAEPITSVTI